MAIFRRLLDFINRNSEPATFASSLVKEKMENRYNDFFQTQFGEQLKDLNPYAKNMIRMMFGSIAAIVEKKMPENGFLLKGLKDVAIDFSSEFNKRMMNHDESRSGKSGNRNAAFQNLMDIDDQELLMSFVGWLNKLTDRERQYIVNQIPGLSAEKIKQLASLKPEQLSAILSAVIDKPKEKKPGASFQEGINFFGNKLQGYINRQKRGANNGE